MGMSPRGGTAAPVTRINRLLRLLSMASEHERDTRDEQQRQHDFPERCLVNPSKQPEPKPRSCEKSWRPVTKNLAEISLVLLLDLAAAVDDERHFLAVLGCLD